MKKKYSRRLALFAGKKNKLGPRIARMDANKKQPHFVASFYTVLHHARPARAARVCRVSGTRAKEIFSWHGEPCGSTRVLVYTRQFSPPISANLRNQRPELFSSVLPSASQMKIV
jgi:hypothetical protein